MGRGRTSFLAGAVLSLVFVFPHAVLAIRVTCEDGGSAVIAGFGRRFASGGTCDIDHSCDGICTFALNVPCMRCRLGRGCPNPDAAAAECLDDAEPPCPSNIRPLAVRACADGDLPFYDGGAVSPSGFTLATGNCCGVSNGDQLFDFSRTLSGTLPAGAGGIAVTDRWSFSEERGPVTCSRTATGTLVADSVPCAA